ncbi:MAG: VOC family protein [Rhodobacter sp.]|nr:VOC family protein [Rhodobacter sp.]
MNAPACHRLILYTRRIDEMIAFYGAHFGYRPVSAPGDRIVELLPPGDGLRLMLHPAGKGQREGQALVKLVFDVADVPARRAALLAAGLEVGPVHDGGGYQFANLKDPSKNPVSISSRAFRAPGGGPG